MTLLQPAALAFAALAPVIVLLYLLKLRRQPAHVSTLMFWQRITADHRRRALFQRLRRWLSLLLQLLIFALLLLALARPELSGRSGGEIGRATAVVVDCRARLQTAAFATAREVAEGYLRLASVREPVALLAAEAAPRVVAGFAVDEKPLLDALRRLRAEDGGGRIEEAIAAARDLLASRPGGGRIVVITDHPLAAAGPDVEVRLADAGGLRENVGIVRLAARPLPNSPETNEVLVELENFGAARQTGSVELSFEGALVDVKPFDLAPGERRTDVYPALAPDAHLANARGWLTAHLTLPRPDAFPLDDDAYAVVAAPAPLRVLLVSRGNLYLESLLKADTGLRYDLLAPESFQPAQAAGFDAVILDDALPPGCEKLDGLAPGNYLFLRQTPFDLPGPPLERPVVTDLEAGHPALRLVNLRDILFFRATPLALPKDAAGWRLAAPARALDRPLVVTGESGNRRLAAFAFGVTDSELPLRVAFPLLVRNTLGWLAGRDETVSGSTARAGEPITLADGETGWTEPQRSYAPTPAAIPPDQSIRGPAPWRPTRNGFYLRRDRAGGDHWMAVNTEDREMSALNAPASRGEPAPVINHVRWPALASWPWWSYLALAALALCAGEWWTFHRRRTE